MTVKSKLGKELVGLALEYQESKRESEEMIDKDRFYSKDISIAVGYMKELPKDERLKIVRRWRTGSLLGFHSVDVHDETFQKRFRDISLYNRIAGNGVIADIPWNDQEAETDKIKVDPNLTSLVNDLVQKALKRLGRKY